MKRIKYVLPIVIFVFTSCTTTVERGGEGIIYPDYTDVTIPCNIAPLNFIYNHLQKGTVTTFSFEESTIRIKGNEVVWKESTWRSLLEKAAGDTILVTNSRGDKWTIAVSPDSIDTYLTYRLIEPGYEVWHEVEIVERNLSNFEETVISDFRNTDNACMNCHIHGQNRGDWSIFYVRGPKGGAMLNCGGTVRKLNLKADGMVSSTVYGELHPEGRFGVFSTNIIVPSFHTLKSLRFEVYDSVSDIVVADFENNRMITTEAFARDDKFETFPVFSADGQYVYYCSADTVSLPREIEKLRYSLFRTHFNTDGTLGPEVETVWSAAANNGSACHPKCSPDGRWLMYTVADYGTFPIWHQECELQLLNLQTGAIDTLAGVNAFRSDSYHSWSSNSRWFTFASKRDDGQFGKPYFCHIASDGTTSKPFVLPQKNPRFYDSFFRSFNIPDLGRTSVGFDAARIGRIVKEEEAEPFR